jgi:hypothetical protein
MGKGNWCHEEMRAGCHYECTYHGAGHLMSWGNEGRLPLWMYVPWGRASDVMRKWRQAAPRPCPITVTFSLSPPKSWTRKNKLCTQLHVNSTLKLIKEHPYSICLLLMLPESTALAIKTTVWGRGAVHIALCYICSKAVANITETMYLTICTVFKKWQLKGLCSSDKCECFWSWTFSWESINCRQCIIDCFQI